MNRNRFERHATLLSCFVLSLGMTTGCGQPGPVLLPVSGKVTLNGNPAIEGGVIYRSVENPAMQLVGAIRPDGTYVMMKNRDQGAPPGEYVVTVLVTETPKGPDGQYSGLPKTISHRKFSDPTTTPLKVEVKEDAAPNAYDLDVTG